MKDKQQLLRDLSSAYESFEDFSKVSKKGEYVTLDQRIQNLYRLVTVTVTDLSPYKLKIGGKWVPRCEIRFSKVVPGDRVDELTVLVTEYDSCLKFESDLVYKLRDLQDGNFKRVRDASPEIKAELMALLDKL